MEKFYATWLSHSSISDYLTCPASYYLKNIYKDPATNHKLQLVTPALSLGVCVHEVLEGLALLPLAQRFKKNLILTYEQHWHNVTGEKGGFTHESIEKEYKERGLLMLNRVWENPGPLANLAVKIKSELPHFYLSREENLILCGKIDWLEYQTATQSVHIIDFKTGRKLEKDDSLQLPIYFLLATYCQKYPIAQASYWYLALHDHLTPKKLPDLTTAKTKILAIGQRIALARKLKSFKCPHGGCPACEPFERLIKGEGKKVGENLTMKRDLYLLSNSQTTTATEEIL